MTITTLEQIKIEPFDKSDASYEAVATIDSAIYEQYPTTAEDHKRWRQQSQP